LTKLRKWGEQGGRENGRKDEQNKRFTKRRKVTQRNGVIPIVKEGGGAGGGTKPSSGREILNLLGYRALSKDREPAARFTSVGRENG